MFTLRTSEASEPIRVHPGYVYKFRCSGRLLVSAIGNEKLVRIEALPKETGCSVLAKTEAAHGATNIYLETTVESVNRIIEIVPGRPNLTDLDRSLSGGAQ